MKEHVLNKISNSFLSGGVNTFVNPYSYLMLRKTPDVLNGVDRILVDGQLMVRLLSWLGVSSVTRKSFDMTSLAPIVFQNTIDSKGTICFVGSKAEEVEASMLIIAEAFPALNIVYFRDGYFSGAERLAELKKIRTLSPDVVIAGLGTPRQEEFLIDLKKIGWNGTGFTCGGFLHQTASGIEYYPVWMDKLNLRWMYRIYDEPVLFKRYFWEYPKAVVQIVYDLKIKPAFSHLVS